MVYPIEELKGILSRAREFETNANLSKECHKILAISPDEFLNKISRFDSTELLLAGHYRLFDLYAKGPKNFEDYLVKAKSLMRNLEVPKETISPKDPDYGMKLHRAFIEFIDPIRTEDPNPTWEYMWKNRVELERILDFSNDLRFNYLGISNIEEMYLLRLKKEIIELPQYLFLRIAVTLYMGDMEKIKTAYFDMSNHRIMPASPTLFNAGTTFSQMSSCFLVSVEDNLPSILWTHYVVGTISKHKGATGISFSNLRGAGSVIGSNGICSGTLNFLRNIDTNVLYIAQGGNRPGSAQVCMPIYHVDIIGHIESTLKTGNPDLRVKKVNTSIGFHDFFFNRLAQDGEWSLFCPSEVPLSNLYGQAFEEAYLKAEAEGKAKKKLPAREIMELISRSLRESGNPYLINLDAINMKSNQKNIGMVKTLNLCQEIALVSDSKRIPSCNLTSICLPSALRKTDERLFFFDFSELARLSREAVFNLNKVIEKNYYPLPEIRFANEESAPIGIGFQGAVDVIFALDLIFDSEEADLLMEKIVACCYFNALAASMELARSRGYPYRAFKGSPFSKGELQFDMWNKKPLDPSEWGQSRNGIFTVGEDSLDSWENLKDLIKIHGTANSQLTTSQPTASVSTITGLNESWEIPPANIYSRDINAGNFQVVNSWLQRDLEQLGLWSQELTTWIFINDGSIADLVSIIPESAQKEKHLQRLTFLTRKYRTAFEFYPKVSLKHAAVRGPYIDGSQSTNVYMKGGDCKTISDLICYAQKLGLKTLLYYLRSREAKTAIKAVRQRKKVIDFVEKPNESIGYCDRSVGCLSCQ